jgi:RNA polymerase sigma factor (sigma-70 family)
MSESRTDFELLGDFIRRGDQRAFADVVRRHLALVYATALRKTEDQGAAEEVAQNVFATLAKKAWRFAPEDSLAAWLYKTTLLEAKEWLRGELRRRRRDQTAAELGTTMKTPDEQTAFRALLPLLDEALMSLREKERTALLLRFYESQSLREVGTALGVTEDNARKRVAGALEKIARFFQNRGFKTASVAAATAAFQHTAKSAPAASAAKILGASAAFAPPAGVGLGLVTRVIGLSKVQTLAACTAVAIVPLAWQWQQMHSSARSLVAMEQSLKAKDLQYHDATASLEKLRSEEARLIAAEVAADQTRDRQKLGAQKLATLRAQAQALVSGQEYRWQDEVPFARIPKSAVSSLNTWSGPLTPDKMQVKIQSALGLNPQETQAAMQVFSNYYSAIDRALQASDYETNQSSRLHLPEGAQSMVFGMKPLGPQIRSAMDDLCSNLESVLGSDRWAMVNPNRWEMTHYEQVRLLGYSQFAWDTGQEFAGNLFIDNGAEPTVSFTGEGGVGTGAVPLKWFLPRSAGSKKSQGQQFLDTVLNGYPDSIGKRLNQWALTQAVRFQNNN